MLDYDLKYNSSIHNDSLGFESVDFFDVGELDSVILKEAAMTDHHLFIQHEG